MTRFNFENQISKARTFSYIIIVLYLPWGLNDFQHLWSRSNESISVHMTTTYRSTTVESRCILYWTQHKELGSPLMTFLCWNILNN